jgi:hypothetical protein
MVSHPPPRAPARNPAGAASISRLRTPGPAAWAGITMVPRATQA